MTSQRRGDLTCLRDVGCGWREGYGRAAWPSELKNKRTKKLNEKKKNPSVLLFKSVASSTVSSPPESQETSKNKQVFQILQTTAEAPEGKKKKAGQRSKTQREISASAQNNSAPSSGYPTIEKASPAAAFSPRRCNMKCCRHSTANSDQTGQ